MFWQTSRSDEDGLPVEARFGVQVFMEFGGGCVEGCFAGGAGGVRALRHLGILQLSSVRPQKAEYGSPGGFKVFSRFRS